ncbi:MAG: peptidoglycan bridge formation glycyltransferase FemA/FemB family protein [bacterium]|nr:peptidoglycan bridge formation glycyltransferase FemA/FemB family protein [bacterium]
MEIREITDKNTWENFLSGCSEKTFLQSWHWGEFSQNMGEKIWRLGIFDQNELIAMALTEKKMSKRGTFLLVPHGPVTKSATPELKAKILDALTKRLKPLASEEKISFIRINPIWERNPENDGLFKDFRLAPLQMHPESSWKLDITLPEENLLAEMRKTTRYLIKQAQKNQSIRISQSHDFADVERFSQFHNQVSRKQHFVPFSLEYLQKEFQAFEKDDAVRLFFGYYNNEVAAGSFVIFWSGIGFYHHAISLPQYAKFSLPYLLQWEAIKEAKRRGCHLYDFWGFVDPQKQPRHPWAGPTLFKMGFGGQADEYVKTRDLVLSPQYWLTYFLEKLRKAKRRL